MKRPFLPLAILLSFAPFATAAAQTDGGFDFRNLQIPPGFFDLQDLVIVTANNGSVTATATTTFGDANALVLLSSLRTPTGRGLVFGVKPQNWSLTRAIPALANPVLDALTFEHVALVMSDQDVRMPAAGLEEAERAFYGEVYGSDDFTLVLKPGINLIAAIPAEGLPQDSPLKAVMDALGIEKGTLLLQGTLGKSLTLLRGGVTADALKDLYLRAELPPMRPPGSPEWFRSGQLALELTGEPSVRLVGELNVFIDETDLKFFLAAMLARTGISLSGGMVAEQPWVSPLGVEWLTLKKVILKLGITPTGSVALGFAGAAVIGEKDIDVAVALAVSPAGVPTNFMMKGESDSGVALSDLAKVQAAMAAARDAAAGATGVPAGGTLIPIDALPDIQIRTLGLQFAPKPDLELGIERGFKIKGQLWLPTGPGGEMKNFAGVDAGVTDDGLWINGHLGAFQVGPLTWDDAVLDLAATRQEQHLIVKGQVQLGATRQLVDLNITRQALRFRCETELFGLFHATLSARSAFELTNPSFAVDAVVSNDFGEFVQPILREGMVRFASTGQGIIDATQTALGVSRDALAVSAASAAQLRAALQGLRDNAEGNWRDAQNRANARRADADAAWRDRENARRLWENTPRREPARRAARYAEYVRLSGVHAARASAYAAQQTAANARRAILDAIPSPDQSVVLLAAEAAVARLRAQLQEAERNLAVLETRYTQMIAAIEAGADPLAIEYAEFHANLAVVQGGGAMSWVLRGRFVGQPFELRRQLDFRSPAQAVAEILTGLMSG